MFQLLLFPAVCNKCFILTGSFDFSVTAKAQVKTLDRAFQLVKQQNISSVKQLRLNNPVSDNSKGLNEEVFCYPKRSSSTPWCQKLPLTALGTIQCWSDRNRCVSPQLTEECKDEPLKDALSSSFQCFMLINTSHPFANDLFKTAQLTVTRQTRISTSRLLRRSETLGPSQPFC